ncbi:hypothetical protein A5804_002778 [Enterococcus faecium]|uniref:DUF805 domain-containing protein n=1 Tax=Enterococcus faecium TaxID=1352 RepID=A0AB73PJT8_ENTFC|nr:DUF805 domain-containing protein [Enterococcus faecium]EME8125206.1 DUF805 domain-containing protein [Enterococcus faecium]OTN94467.1 hypothetical protein A5804_002778 [Enterococcus faecium]
MIQAYKNFWKQAFNYKGVSTRKDYWLVALANALIGLILGILIGITGAMNEVEILLGMIVLLIFYCLAVLVPTLPLCVRRLRDAGFHWAFMFFNFIPYIGSLVLTVLYCMPTKNKVVE